MIFFLIIVSYIYISNFILQFIEIYIFYGSWEEKIRWVCVLHTRQITWAIGDTQSPTIFLSCENHL